MAFQRDDRAPSGLQARGEPLVGFELAGSDGKFVKAEASIDGSSVILSSPAVEAPVQARYAWADDPEGNLINGAGHAVYQTAFVGKWHLDNPDDVETWAWGHDFDYAVQEQWPARFGGREFPPARLWVNGDQEFIPYDYRQYRTLRGPGLAGD